MRKKDRKYLVTRGKKAVSTILRIINKKDKGVLLSEMTWKEIEDLFRGKKIEELNISHIEGMRVELVDINQDSLVDYYEEVIELKGLVTSMRVCKGLYDLVEILSQLREED